METLKNILYTNVFSNMLVHTLKSTKIRKQNMWKISNKVGNILVNICEIYATNANGKTI